jgi:integrase
LSEKGLEKAMVKAGDTQQEQQDIKGKLIEFAWKLKREGITEVTIKNYTKILRLLTEDGANLLDADSVKDVIARKKWSVTSKAYAVAVYQKFAKIEKIAWQPPKYKVNQKLPFIPLESEIDSLIAFCGKKTSTILQLLKETGMRIGEALRLKWTDVDSNSNTIVLNETEKNGIPRMFKVSSKLIGMINNLPKRKETIFGVRFINNLETDFNYQRKRAAQKLQNPRLLRITFHTLRHWKATMEYHKTKDILHVMQLLGHRNIQNTLIYTQLVKFENEEEYHSATAKTLEEAKQLIEAGFEYITDMEGIKLFRKRK